MAFLDFLSNMDPTNIAKPKQAKLGAAPMDFSGAIAQTQNSQAYNPQLDNRAFGANISQPLGFQNFLANQYMGQAMGQGPSLAQAQLQNATEANMAAAMAQAGSMRGGNPAAMARGLVNQVGDLNQQAANQSAMLRMQEQQNALAGLGATASNMGQLQLGQGAQAQQGALAQAELGLKGLGMQNDFVSQLAQLANQRDLGKLNADQSFQGQLLARNQGIASTKGGLLGGALGGIGSAIMDKIF